MRLITLVKLIYLSTYQILLDSEKSRADNLIFNFTNTVIYQLIFSDIFNTLF